MMQPEWEVRCRLRFRLFGKDYGYEDQVPTWESGAMQIADVHTTLLGCGGARGKKQEREETHEKQARGRMHEERPQLCEHASATGIMRIELAAAAPSMQRMMLQRALDKGKFAAWERATEAERDMCMHLPQSELLDALDSGNSGVGQLLESVRISLMVEHAAEAEEGGRDESETAGRGPRSEPFNARYRRWCGTRLPPMSSKAFPWSMQKRPYCGFRGRCATEYAQYSVGYFKMQSNHATRSWQTCCSFTVDNYFCACRHWAPTKKPRICSKKTSLCVGRVAGALTKVKVQRSKA